MGVRESDIPDASQDVFIVVHRRLREYEGRAALRTWLYAICRRTASNYRRRLRRRREGSPFEERFHWAPASQEREAMLRGTSRRAVAALAKLKPAHRQVLVNHDIEQKSVKEVAALTGTGTRTTYARLYAARRELRRALQRAGHSAVVLA